MTFNVKQLTIRLAILLIKNLIKMKHSSFSLTKLGFNSPWGFRIQGGRDFNRPLIISRITCESVANNNGLKCGDQITKINNNDTTFMTHNEAQQIIIMAGSNLNLEILRESSPAMDKSRTTNLNSFSIPKFSMGRNSGFSSPRTGFATDIQMSHSNFDLKHRTPFCNLCKTEIRGPFIIVLDYCFCPNHFTCCHCHKDLSKTSFLEVEGLFFCTEDYTAFIAPSCRKCNKPIVGNEVTAMDNKWHFHCFKCNRCGINLGDKFFKVGDDNIPYCEEDWNELFQVKCSRCSLPITVLDKFVEVGQSAFHSKCFCCSACRISLEGKPFHNRNGKPFCRVHANAGTMF